MQFFTTISFYGLSIFAWIQLRHSTSRACFIYFCAAFHRNFFSDEYRNFCSESFYRNFCNPHNRNFCEKQDLSLLFWITASKAQSPCPGFEDPCTKLIPWFLPLVIALANIKFFWSVKRDAIWQDGLVGCFGWGFRKCFFLLLLGMFAIELSEIAHV